MIILLKTILKIFKNILKKYEKKFKREKDITRVEFESTTTIQGVS